MHAAKGVEALYALQHCESSDLPCSAALSEASSLHLNWAWKIQLQTVRTRELHNMASMVDSKTLSLTICGGLDHYCTLCCHCYD